MLINMNIFEAKEYIKSLKVLGVNPGLERISLLCGKLNNPQSRLCFIHIAGTNGKGSTAMMISEILSEAGYKTGLFTSPYVTDIKESIKINGKNIGDDIFVSSVEKCKKAAAEMADINIYPTEFEVLTAVSFLCFEHENCDIVVLECGMGGRLDSTNIIDRALVSVITPVSLDHTSFLGETVEQIAFEKCGIIKKNSVTVSAYGQTEKVLEVIKNTSDLQGNQLIISDENDVKFIAESIYETRAVIQGMEISIYMPGRFFTYNALTAINTVKALKEKGFSVTEENIINGIKCAKLPARIEIVGENPQIITDGGHNVKAAEALFELIKSCGSAGKVIAVISMMRDKDYDGYLKVISKAADIFVVTKASNDRSLEIETLSIAAEKYCETVYISDIPKNAVEKAIELSDERDIIIICGSFYLAADTRSYFIETE